MSKQVLKLEEASTKDYDGGGGDYEDVIVTIQFVENGYIYVEESDAGVIRKVFENKSDLVNYLKGRL